MFKREMLKREMMLKRGEMMLKWGENPVDRTRHKRCIKMVTQKRGGGELIPSQQNTETHKMLSWLEGKISEIAMYSVYA